MTSHLACAACPYCASDPSTGRVEDSAPHLIACPSCHRPLWRTSSAVADFYFRFDRAGTDAFIDLLESRDPDHPGLPFARNVLTIGIAVTRKGLGWHEAGVRYLTLAAGDSLDAVEVIMELEDEGILDDPDVRRAFEELVESHGGAERPRPQPIRDDRCGNS